LKSGIAAELQQDQLSSTQYQPAKPLPVFRQKSWARQAAISPLSACTN
jgi:hypothetical protein